MRWSRVLLLLVVIGHALAQYGTFYDSDDDRDENSDDPLRRTLSILKRFVNRVNDNNTQQGNKLRFDDNTDVRQLSALIKQQQGTRAKSDMIISEELLQRLMPRVMGQTLPPKTVMTTTFIPTTENFSNVASQSTTVTELFESTPVPLSGEDLRSAQILAEALRILMRDEDANSSKVVEKFKEVVNVVSVLSKNAHSAENVTSFEESVNEQTSSSVMTTTTNAPSELETATVTIENQESTIQAEITSQKFKVTSIPEAEEEDETPIKKGLQNIDVSTSTPATSQTQPVFNLNSNSNIPSDSQIASVLTPVNSFVDGISPLIFPLLGYSRQALANYGTQTNALPNHNPEQAQKPVQVRNYPVVVNTSAQQFTQPQRAAAAPIISRPDLYTPNSLSSASDAELIQAFQNAFKENPAIIQAFAQGQLLSKPTLSPSSTITKTPPQYLLQPQNNNAQQSVSKVHMALLKQRQMVESQQLAQQQQRQTLREVVDTLHSLEATTYYPHQLERFNGQRGDGQNALAQSSQQVSTRPVLPVASEPDPGYNDGLRRVSAFESDSGVLIENKGLPSAAENSPLQQRSFNQNTPFISQSLFGGGSGGIGGGRRPVSTFEEVEKNTLPDHTFFG